MKKELFALLTVVLLVVGAVMNILHLKRIVTRMEAHVTAAETACETQRYDIAETELSKALQIWLEADSYTHVFIRHGEIDCTADAFYEAMERIRCEDSRAASAALEKLRYHLQSILTMEYVTLQSVC